MTHVMSGMACEVRPGDPCAHKAFRRWPWSSWTSCTPHVSGIELLERLGIDRAFEVVFVTAHGDRILSALRLCAFDHLLKPIDVDELAAMVQRLKQKRRSLAGGARAQALRAALADRLPVHTTKGTELIELATITRIEASGSYSVIHASGLPKPRSISRKLGELEAALEGRGFVRAHRAHLVNVKHIMRYTPTKYAATLQLTDGTTVEVARAKKHLFGGLGPRSRPQT